MAEATTSSPDPLPTIILFGDSLTEYSFDRQHGKGFGHVLAEHYKDKAEVTNDGEFRLF
jgi:hypothetical protein